MGYLDFDGERYWDVRYTPSYVPQPVPKDEKVLQDNQDGLRLVLESDTTLRADSCALLDGDIEQAQVNKNDMEELQRHDRKLREAAEKRRKAGGAKISYEEYPNSS